MWRRAMWSGARWGRAVWRPNAGAALCLVGAACSLGVWQVAGAATTPTAPARPHHGVRAEQGGFEHDRSCFETGGRPVVLMSMTGPEQRCGGVEP